MKKFYTITLLLLLLSCILGCGSRLAYHPPNTIKLADNSIILHKSKDDIWKTTIPSIGKNFFVINNLDKESGIINISYSGNPEMYIDCGNIESYVRNARGERTYHFPASSALQHYETMERGTLLFVDRGMDLDGRMNIVVEEIDTNTTLLTVNTKYLLTRSIFIRDFMGNSIGPRYDKISFNSNQVGKFPPYGSHSGTICQPNGKFEQEIISILLDGNK